MKKRILSIMLSCVILLANFALIAGAENLSETEPTDASQPSTTQPVETQPVETQPSTTQSATAKPSTTKPSTTKASTTKPSSTQSTTTQSTVTQSTTTQSTTSQTATSQSTTLKTSAVKPAAAKVQEVFPHAIAYSTVKDLGLEKRVQAMEVIEYETGRIVVDTDINKPYNPESRDVILMAVYTASTIIRGDSVVVTKEAVTDPKNNTLMLKEGMTVALVDVMAAALLSNDINAVNVLAISAAETPQNFIKKMNNVARSAGMLHTTFTNITGKPDPNQVTTVSDMTVLAFLCYRNQTITDITSSESHFIKTDEIIDQKKEINNSFEVVNSTSDFYNRSIYGIGVSKDSKGITTSIVTYITSKQKFIFVIRSTGGTYYNDIADSIDFVKKNYALIDISKIIFELGDNASFEINGEKVYFAAMKNTLSNANVVANLYYSKSVSTLSSAYSIEPPENMPEKVKVGDRISNFRIMYNGSQISTISLAVKSIGEKVEEETTLGFTLYQASDVKLQKGSFIQEHSWMIIVAAVIVVGAVAIIVVNKLKNI